MTNQQDGQIVMVVLVSVADPAAIDHHATIQQRSFAFPNGPHFAEQVGQLFGMEQINLGQLFDLFGIILMMR